jgi:Tol biopolymer transport system component
VTRLARAWVIAIPALALCATAYGAVGDLTLASTSDSGVKGNADSFHTHLSADGAVVAFHSLATNLVSGDSDTVADVYVKNVATGNIELASTSDSGQKGNGDSTVAFLTPDASKVAFNSKATNLDPGDGDTISDIYLKDLVTGNITLASTSDTEVKANGDGLHPSVDASGTKVAFYSYATNLDPADKDSKSDIYVKNLVTGDIKLVSTSGAGIKGNGESTIPFMSADGTAVAFGSLATNLASGDRDSTSDLYVKNLVTGRIRVVSRSDAGRKGNGASLDPWVSSDGSRVAFSSRATNLDPADKASNRDIFVKDLVTGDLFLASSSDGGTAGNAHSSEPSLSADGTRVLFHSLASNLDPADPDSVNDIFVKNLASGDIYLASRSSSGQKGNRGSVVPSLSPNGRVAAFRSSATNLDPADSDSAWDIYVKQLP